MKIGDAPKSAGKSRIESKYGASSASTTSFAERSAAPVDTVMLAGIPEPELTPKVREALFSLMEEVQSLRTELNETRERLSEIERLADRDPMLDVYNRRAFVRELNRSLAMVDRYAMSASLVFVDLNDLKKINDGMGHNAGDAALSVVADVLTANVRQMDSVGRIGGDEFGVLLTNADQATAEFKAEQLAHAVSAKPVPWKDSVFTATISCGVVELTKGLTAIEAMERADSAMYKVKSAKRGG